MFYDHLFYLQLFDYQRRGIFILLIVRTNTLGQGGGGNNKNRYERGKNRLNLMGINNKNKVEGVKVVMG